MIEERADVMQDDSSAARSSRSKSGLIGKGDVFRDGDLSRWWTDHQHCPRCSSSVFTVNGRWGWSMTQHVFFAANLMMSGGVAAALPPSGVEGMDRRPLIGRGDVRQRPDSLQRIASSDHHPARPCRRDRRGSIDRGGVGAPNLR